MAEVLSVERRWDGDWGDDCRVAAGAEAGEVGRRGRDWREEGSTLWRDRGAALDRWSGWLGLSGWIERLRERPSMVLGRAEGLILGPDLGKELGPMVANGRAVKWCRYVNVDRVWGGVHGPARGAGEVAAVTALDQVWHGGRGRSGRTILVRCERHDEICFSKSRRRRVKARERNKCS